MPEPERSIEELVEGLERAATRLGMCGCASEAVCPHAGITVAARATLLRAVARLREENDGFRKLAGGYVRVAPSPRMEGQTVPIPPIEEEG